MPEDAGNGKVGRVYCTESGNHMLCAGTCMHMEWKDAVLRIVRLHRL